MILTSNFVPDGCYTRKLTIIPFKARFTHNPDKRYEYPDDRNILEKLLEENNKSAFLNWILHG